MVKVTLGAARAQGQLAPRTQNGGVYIWGRNPASGLSMAVMLLSEGDSATVTMPFGTWEFHAMGFSGSNDAFTGTPICGQTSRTLDSNTSSVSITISSATPCSGDSFYGSSAPVPLRFTTCNSFSSISDGGSTCSGLAKGDLRSFEVLVHGYNVTADSQNRVPTRSMRTGCVNLASPSVDNTVVSSFKVPEGTGSLSPIYVTVIGYTGTGCSSGGGTPYSFEFQRGLKAVPATATDRRFLPPANPYLGSNALFLLHGSQPAPTISSVSPSSGAWGGKTPITITGTNFDTGASVTLNGSTCTVTSSSLTSIQCTTPRSGSTGAATLNVTNPDGQGVGTTTAFSYVDDTFGNAANVGASGVGSTFRVTSSFFTDAANTLGLRPFHAYRNVTAVATTTSGSVVAGKTVTVPSFTSTEFQAGDAVLWHVSATSSSTACSSSGDLPVGKYGVSLIASADTATSKITLRDTITATPNNTNIGATNRNSGQTFCLMQLVRIASLENLTIDSTSSGASVQIKAPALDLTNGYGGIVAVQVTGTLTTDGLHSGEFYAAETGYPGGAGSSSGGTQGSGSTGIGLATTASANGSGGGAGFVTAGAGGGGNYGAGGDGSVNTGSGGAANAACDPFASSCAMFGGGGGGPSTTGKSGGNGGGIVLVWARTVAQGSGSSPLYLVANSRITATSFDGGGGAGGTAYLRTIDATGATPHLEGRGGDAGANGYTNGDGAGGWAYHVGCGSTAPSSPVLVATAGAAGTAAGAGQTGNNLYGSGNFFCP